MSVRGKLMLGIMGIAFLASGATGSYFYWQAKTAMLNAIKQELKTAAVIGAKLVPASALRSLQNPEQNTTQAYKKIQNLMGSLAQSTEEFLYAYTMRLRGDQVQFIVDSPPSDDNQDGTISPSEMPAPLGEVYPNPPQSLLRGFVQPAVDSEPWQDEWGWALSGYAPIRSASGEQIGLLGIDMSLARIQDKLTAIRWAGLVSLGVALVVALTLTEVMSRQILRPLRQLQAGVQRVADGDFETPLVIKRQDELGWVMGYFNHMLHQLKEKEILKNHLGKVVNRKIMNRFMEGELELGGEVMDATVLFCDLHQFTQLSTKLPPHLLVDLLNEYFTAMVREVERRGGMVDKFVGDALMAVFEHSDQEDHAEAVVQAALAMLAQCEHINATRRLEGDFALHNFVGIHCGPVVAGNIGSPERMEYTCIGDTVNVAARLEKATRTGDTRIMISMRFRQRLTNSRDLFAPGRDVSLPGRQEPIQVAVLKQEASDSGLSSSPA